MRSSAGEGVCSLGPSSNAEPAGLLLWEISSVPDMLCSRLERARCHLRWMMYSKHLPLASKELEDGYSMWYQLRQHCI